MNNALDRILPRVQKPARYTGGEYNQIVKDLTQVDTRVALCFPDTYEIGMSNLGMRILYGIWNAMPGVWCERVFAPWGDMEEEMRAAGIPLWGLESGDPLERFHMVAFSLGYELAFPAVLNMLELAGLPLLSRDRPELVPLVCAGGTACLNPEPMGEFMDLFILGEGEEVNVQLTEAFRDARRRGLTKAQFLREAAEIEGIYVPSLYDVTYTPQGGVASRTAREGAPQRVRKRIAEDFDAAYFPVKAIVPSTEIVHDRVALELFRGCIRGCRFCQAGFVYRPVRTRRPETLLRLAKEALSDSGYEELTLSSLSSSDYPQLEELTGELLAWCEPRRVSLSLPSLRVDSFSVSLMEAVQKVRKTGLTFAPEAGTQRLRDVINKNVTEEDLLSACRTAFAGGWNGVKLYFMLGLPTETDEDVLGIAAMVGKLLSVWRESAKNKARGVRITVSTACFIPKPHTPFQWAPQVTPEEYLRRVTLLRENIKWKNVTYNWHSPEVSVVEAALARGDRRLGQALLALHQAGGRLETWGDFFSLDRWEEAFRDAGLELYSYARREREEEEALPWDFIDVGVNRDYLLREKHRAEAGESTPDCRTACAGCGASALLEGGSCHV